VEAFMALNSKLDDVEKY